jgi:hypothetical protein
MTNYTIKQDQTHGEVLCKNNMECICPFQPAIPTQSQMGGLAIMRIPCSTSCAHAEHLMYTTDTGEINEYIMTCSGHIVTLEIDQVPTESKLIKL